MWWAVQLRYSFQIWVYTWVLVADFRFGHWVGDWGSDLDLWSQIWVLGWRFTNLDLGIGLGIEILNQLIDFRFGFSFGSCFHTTLYMQIPHQSLFWYAFHLCSVWLIPIDLVYAVCNMKFKCAYQVYVIMLVRNTQIFVRKAHTYI